MNTQDISFALENIMLQDFGLSKEDLHPEKNIESDLGIDSIDIVLLTINCEEKFNIRISDSEMLAVRKYGDFVNLVEKSVAESNV